MRITSIDHRPYDFEDGLSDVHLQNLKRIVIISGSNGSGKTRLLSRVENINGQAFDKADSQILYRHRQDDQGKLSNLTSGVRGLRPQALGTTTRPPRAQDIEQILDNPQSPGDIAEARENPHKTIQICSFVARKLNLADSEAMTPKEAGERSQKAADIGASHLADTCLAYVQKCQNREWESTHPKSHLAHSERNELVSKYSSLEDLIFLVLQAKLKRNADGVATLFGKPIATAGLSDGQRALLQWCVGLHAQGAKLKDVILTMDEPENHLHPEALNDTVCRIIDANTDGQVWIGTHSVPLIAALFHKYPDEISLYFMENGRPHFAGRSPEKVLTSLMGGENNIQALREFIDLPGIFASNRFAAECLLSPTVVADQNPDDPQALVTDRAIFQDLPEGQVVKILDCGAGHGRLLDCLHAAHGDSLAGKLDYVAWDISAKPDERCLEAIGKVYGVNEDRWFNNSNAMAAEHAPNTFDAVILCNVLHEISPVHWVSLFANTGLLATCLKASGSLVIVEDYLMPKGEYAHSYGFIVLDTLALQKLFQAGTSDIQVINARGTRYRDRIRAHVVPASLLANVTGEAIKSCLDFAISNAENEIGRMRSSASDDFKKGQAHAFWVQQFTNATLARKAFG